MDFGKYKQLIISVASTIVVVLVIGWLILRGCEGQGFDGKPLYKVGRDSTWWPVDLRGKERSMAGFSNDLIKESLSREGARSVVFEVGPHSLLDGLRIRRYDAIFSSMTPNIVNSKQYLFSDPYYLIGPVLIVRKNSPVKNLKDLEGRVLGIESGRLQVYNMAEPPDTVMIPYDTAAEALESLSENVIDGVILDALRAYVWTEGFYQGQLKVITSPLTNRGLRLVTLNEPEGIKLISLFNAGLKKVQEEGRYLELIQKWSLVNTEISPEEVE